MISISLNSEPPKEGTEPNEVELLEDIKTLLEDYKKEREDTSVSQQELVTTDDQYNLLEKQLNVQTTQLAWVQIIICIGVCYVICRGLYKLIASYCW